MSKTINKSLVVLIILTLIATMFTPIQASAAGDKQAKTFTKNGVKMQYKQKVVKNNSFSSNYAKDLRVVSSSKKATLKWNKVAGSSGYFVLYCNSGNGTYKQLAKTSKTSYTAKKLKKNRTYYYIVYPYKYKHKKYYLANGCTKVATRTTNSSKKPDTVKGASISKGNVEMSIGSTYQLKVNYKGTPFSKWTRWSSSNTKVATVNSSGKVTAKTIGTTTITAKRPSGYNLICKVTVKKIAVQAIKVPDTKAEEGGGPKGAPAESSGYDLLSTDKYTLSYGESVDIDYTIVPSNATNKSVSITSSDTSVLTIKGTTAKNINTTGKTKYVHVTVASKDNSAIKSTFVVTCLSKSINATHIAPVTNASAWGVANDVYAVDADDEDVYFGCELTADSGTVNNTNVKYETNKPEIATFASDGAGGYTRYLRILSNKKLSGSDKFVKITVTDKVSGLSTSFTVAVNETYGQPKPVRSISLNKSSMTMTEGTYDTLSVSFTPANVDNNSISWSSSNYDVVSVSNGQVRAKAQGTATITARSANGKTATCKVTVNPVAVTSISLNKSSIELAPSETSTLTATIKPDNASNKTVSWASNNTSVATVSSSGKITALKEGSAIITAKSSNGKTAVCAVTVKTKPVEVESISVTGTYRNNQYTGTVNAQPGGYSVKLSANVSPANASDKAVTWSSSNTSVATVSSYGTVTILKCGETTIYASSANGVKGSIKIVVSNDIKSITATIPNYYGEVIEGLQCYEMTNESQAVIKLKTNPEYPGRANIVYETEDDDAISIDSNGKITCNIDYNRWVSVWAVDTYTGVKSNELRIHLNKNADENTNIDYMDGTKNTQLGIEMGQPFNESTMKSKFGAPAYVVDCISSTSTKGNTLIYVYDRNGTYENYVEIYVSEGVITGWFTNANEKVTFSDGTKITNETNTLAKLGYEESSASAFGKTYKSNGILYGIKTFRKSPVEKTNIASGVWRKSYVPGVYRNDNYVYDKHMLYITNALRKTQGSKPIAWLDKLKPAAKSAVDSWIEWDSLYNPATGNPHEDKQGRDANERVKQLTTVTNIRAIGENGANSHTGALYEFSIMSGYWTSDGGSAENYSGKHKGNLIAKDGNNLYEYGYSYSKDGYNCMIFCSTETPQ